MDVVEINEEPTELYKILKFENLVASGGEAKYVIAEGLVTVNGEVETRKRKKIFAGDVIDFNGTRFQIKVKAGELDTGDGRRTTKNVRKNRGLS